jgi:hypothetical protein
MSSIISLHRRICCKSLLCRQLFEKVEFQGKALCLCSLLFRPRLILSARSLLFKASHLRERINIFTIELPPIQDIIVFYLWSIVVAPWNCRDD